MKVEFANDRQAWDRYVCDVAPARQYHLWSWREVIEETFGHRPYYLAATDRGQIRGVLPLFSIRSRLFQSCLVSIPFFSYGGVLAETDETREALLERAAELGLEVGVRHIELRPGEQSTMSWLEASSKVTMEIQLDCTADEYWKRLSSGMRNKIRQGQKHGLRTQWGGPKALPIFYSLFATNMRNLGTPVYSPRFFENQVRCFPDRIRILTLWDGEEPVAASFMTAHQDTLELPWSASTLESRKKYSQVLMYWTFIQQAISEGFKRIDLGRCTPGSGTHEFKRHWNPVERRLHWYYWLAPGASIPELRADNAKFKLAIEVWKRLPLLVANGLGPRTRSLNSMTPTSSPARQTQAPRTSPMHVFVLIDALGWQIVKDRSFLNEELKFRTPLKTVLGFSSGAIPSILTGLEPSLTGRWNLLYYDPLNSPFGWLRLFSRLPDKFLNNKFARKAIKELGRRVLGMGPLFECGVSPRLLPWFNWSEKRNIYTADGISGSTSIFDLLKQRDIRHKVYTYHQLSDSQILESAKTDVASGNASFLFLYLSEVDHFLHAECTDQKTVTDRLTWYESQLREIFRLATQRYPQTTFTVISDHGMTPVHSRYDLVRDIQSLGFCMPEKYLAVYDSTMARYWFFDEDVRRTVVEKLEQVTCGGILDDVQLAQLGILFPDRRYGEVIFLLNPGWLIAQSDFNGRDWNPTGMHGYHPSDPHSDAIFLSNRDPHREMISIIDIYTCLSEATS